MDTSDLFRSMKILQKCIVAMVVQCHKQAKIY